MSLRSVLTVAASAATLAATVVLAPAASAAPLVQNGCATAPNGIQRCVQFFYTPGAGRMGASASITDTPAGANYGVKVTDLRLQVLSGGTWTDYLVDRDADGWFPDTDVARTDTHNTCGFPQTRLRVRATFAWRDAAGVVSERVLVTDGSARAMEC